MNPISWSEIEAECGDYRQGFVAIFRKYEGQPTDEKDDLGRTVKVTVNSFASHLGIAEATFRRWVQRVDRRADEPSPPRAKRDLTRDVLRAARHEPDAVVEGILDAPEEQRDAIFHELGRHLRAGRAPSERHEVELAQALHAWINRLNGLLTDGARLFERAQQEQVELDAHGQMALIMYERITERKLDVELRELLESEDARDA